MVPERYQRKLTAILSADVAGYSRLMGEDEAATLDTLNAYREIIKALIQQHRGRLIDFTGDNLLAEFASVVDAVQCAVAVQKELQARNAELPENRRMEFRIGINLGDVIEEGNRIYGDGVNIAARLEALADSGGICVSKTAFDHIESKLPLGYEYLGDQTVKNIAKPVGAYRVLMEPRVTVAEAPEGKKAKPVSRYKALVIGGISVIIVFISFGIWHFFFRPTIEPASVDKMAFQLPDKPSIAVLPFNNMSDDPKQDYFADGITEDLITDLSKVAGIFVIARNSTFAYKGKVIKIRQVAEELSVRYVLEGSVRKANDEVRITAQLIDATTGHHLWAERYDGKMSDIFALQDKINQKIVTALAVRLSGDEQLQVDRKYTENVEAYDSYLEGREHFVRRTPEDFAKAVDHFKKAIKLDPNYGRAYAALALTYWESQHSFWNESLGVSEWEARFLAEDYLQTAMNTPVALAHQVASKIYVDQHEHEKAITEAQQAIALDPNDANNYLTMAYTVIYAGRPREALDFIHKAMRLDPHYPAYYLFVLGLAHFGMEQFERAAALFERALDRNPINRYPLIYLTATYGQLDLTQEAEAAMTKLKKDLPMIDLGFMKFPFMTKYKETIDNSRLVNGLRKAGMQGGVSRLR